MGAGEAMAFTRIQAHYFWSRAKAKCPSKLDVLRPNPTVRCPSSVKSLFTFEFKQKSKNLHQYHYDQPNVSSNSRKLKGSLGSSPFSCELDPSSGSKSDALNSSVP